MITSFSKDAIFVFDKSCSIVFVRTRFVTTRNSIGFVREKAQTISFVERGFERLGLSHQAVSVFVVFIHG